jgi:hypothetical protein
MLRSLPPSNRTREMRQPPTIGFSIRACLAGCTMSLCVEPCVLNPAAHTLVVFRSLCNGGHKRMFQCHLLCDVQHTRLFYWLFDDFDHLDKGWKMRGPNGKLSCFHIKDNGETCAEECCTTSNVFRVNALLGGKSSIFTSPCHN